nr:MAG TPA: hypothetical protein [Bacteriophage sp.]
MSYGTGNGQQYSRIYFMLANTLADAESGKCNDVMDALP